MENEKPNLMDVLGCVSYVLLDHLESQMSVETESMEPVDLVSRGLPVCVMETRKDILRVQLEEKKRKSHICKKIEVLKENIKYGNSSEIIRLLAQLINDSTTDDQKKIIKNEIKFNNSMDYDYDQFGLMPRSGCPQQPQANESQLHSITNTNYLAENNFPSIPIVDSNMSDKSMEKEIDGLRYPISNYNKSEYFLIQKGINYCRSLLAETMNRKEVNFIVDMQRNGVLYYVIHEPTDEKSFAATIVDGFPMRERELHFLLSVDAAAVLHSPIFVQFAQRGVSALLHFLRELRKTSTVTPTELREACCNSRLGDLTVSQILQQSANNLDPTVKRHLETLDRFLSDREKK